MKTLTKRTRYSFEIHKLKGITANQIKIVAVLLMTADHIASYMLMSPSVQSVQNLLHLFGRGAAPLFLYCVTESLRKCTSRQKYLFRLYCAAVCCGLFNIFAEKIIELLFHVSLSFSNILHSYVWLVIFVELIERMCCSYHAKEWIKLLAFSIFFSGAIYFSTLIDSVFLDYSLICNLFDINPNFAQLLLRIKDAFTVSPFRLEYSLEFVLLGCSLYFAKQKTIQCSILAICGVMLYIINLWGLNISSIQPVAVLSIIPIIAIYNRERGNSNKLFFYLYYIVHRFVFACLALSLT